MTELIEFSKQYKTFTIIIFVLCGILATLISSNLYVYMNRHLFDSRIHSSRIMRKVKSGIRRAIRYVETYDIKEKKDSLAVRLFVGFKKTAKKSGYYSNAAAFIYLLLQICMPVLIGFMSFLLNGRNVVMGVSSTALVALLVYRWMSKKANENAEEFKMYAYKIYRFLHNQISAGINAAEAIKNVYRIVDNKRLQDNLLLLSASYAITKDADAALEDFKERYEIQEVESLCVALKQGIDTGDNKDILEKQERLMFSQFFNRVQAETDAIRFKCTVIVVVYAIIIILLIMIPMFLDAGNGVSEILKG